MDANGENVVVLADKPRFDIGDDMASTILYADHYIKKDTLIKLRSVEERLDSCWCDCNFSFYTESPFAEDVNDDEIAEFFFVYFRNDRCDVSPLDTRLRVFSGEEDLTMAGYTELWSTGGELVGDMKALHVMEGASIKDEKIVDEAFALWERYTDQEENPMESN